MSCFPCFGGGKGNNDDADAESPGDAAPAFNMTPPAMVQAPAAYSPAPAAAPAAAAPPKPGGGERAPSASFDRFLDLAYLYSTSKCRDSKTNLISLNQCSEPRAPGFRRRVVAAARHHGAGIRVPRARRGHRPFHAVQPRRRRRLLPGLQGPAREERPGTS